VETAFTNAYEFRETKESMEFASACMLKVVSIMLKQGNVSAKFQTHCMSALRAAVKLIGYSIEEGVLDTVNVLSLIVTPLKPYYKRMVRPWCLGKGDE
jgi:hypothetical protein